MRLTQARVQNYRSIIDTGLFPVDELKTILIGNNEAGKTAILQALQKLSPAENVSELEALRDYPRSKYNDIATNRVNVEDVLVVEGYFKLESGDKSHFPAEFHGIVYRRQLFLDNTYRDDLINIPRHRELPELLRAIKTIVVSMAQQTSHGHADRLNSMLNDAPDEDISGEVSAAALIEKLGPLLPFIEKTNPREAEALRLILDGLVTVQKVAEAHKYCRRHLPVFVLFSNSYRVHSNIHIPHLADRTDGESDDNRSDYGNQCLLRLLGFEARELSKLCLSHESSESASQTLLDYKEQLSRRSYQLNLASVRLSNEIRRVWSPNTERPDENKLRLVVDGAYLRLVVDDGCGFEIDFDQKSEGFQWLVSFFVVLFAETIDKSQNPILLLDEPGHSFHSLKQWEFRSTIARLAEKNQTLFTTHSPFLVGTDELPFVRVVDRISSETGTKVRSAVPEDQESVMPPESFCCGSTSWPTAERNAPALEDLAPGRRAASGRRENVAVLTAPRLSKSVGSAAVSHSYDGRARPLANSSAKDELEDLVRDNLIAVAKQILSWTVLKIPTSQGSLPTLEMFAAEMAEPRKYKLAIAFLRWSEKNRVSTLTREQILFYRDLFEEVKKFLM